MTGLVVVDYGMGNLHSVLSVLRYLGVEPLLSSDPETVAGADALLLPGVGSFRKAMERLNQTGLADALKEAITVRQRKILGICLGQQLMAEYGEEDGGQAGLGFIPGAVTRLPPVPGLKVPHVGFNTVRFDSGSRLADGLGEAVDVYFVHSYHVKAEDEEQVKGHGHYGVDFAAAMGQDNVFAVQFHPEKSHNAGLALLKNFLNWDGQS